MRKIILASTSTLFGETYLEYLLPELSLLFKDCQTILFIPYARPNGITFDQYTDLVAQTLSKLNIKVKGIHEFSDAASAIRNAEGVFTGGGNTFVLVNELYKHNLIIPFRDTIKNGTPYLGTSAGSVIGGLSMQTTNDMPIVYPPSFQTLGLIPFNINAHFLDSPLLPNHMGETRETRIKEYHTYNTPPVLGLREGSWLDIKGYKTILKGNPDAVLFRQNTHAEIIKANSDISHIK